MTEKTIARVFQASIFCYFGTISFNTYWCGFLTSLDKTLLISRCELFDYNFTDKYFNLQQVYFVFTKDKAANNSLKTDNCVTAIPHASEYKDAHYVGIAITHLTDCYFFL